MTSRFSTVGFRSALATLFPDKSTRRASRFLDKSQRAVQRWLEVEQAPPNIMGMMQHQVERLDVTGFPGDLDALVANAKTNDIHPEVIAAYLAKHYTALLGREIE
tara:strand:+ start:12245 stop:12559 length:315 start_codon:yes stop_codon:yes gene_type:complete